MNLTKIALPLVLKAGAEIKPMQHGIIADIKEDDTPVTAADYRSQEILSQLEGITKTPFLGEESSPALYKEKLALYKKLGEAWSVDPIDGTKHFANGEDSYAISVGYIKDGRPVFGVVYAPALNRLFMAEEGKGAWELNPDTLQRTKLSLLRNPTQENITLYLSDSEFSKSTEYPYMLQILKDRGYKIGDNRITTCGSFALKAALVAAGEADVYMALSSMNKRTGIIKQTKEWDSAAAQIIAKEAGGLLTDCKGRTITYGKDNPENTFGAFVSNNKANHEKYLNYFLGSHNVEDFLLR